MKKLINKIIKGTKITFHSIITFIFALSLSELFFTNPILFIASLLPIISICSIEVAKIKDILMDNKIKKSIFSIYKNGKIEQNLLSHPSKALKLLFSKENKQEIFQQELNNLFKEALKSNEYKEGMKLNTVSHALTYRYLQDLQKKGYIKDLQKENNGKKMLFAEKLLIGNFKNLTKKENTYKISFTINKNPRKTIEKKEPKTIEIKNENQENENQEAITHTISTYHNDKTIENKTEIPLSIELQEMLNDKENQETITHTNSAQPNDTTNKELQEMLNDKENQETITHKISAQPNDTTNKELQDMFNNEEITNTTEQQKHL